MPENEIQEKNEPGYNQFNDKEFWRSEIDNSENEEIRRDWLRAGKQSAALLSRRIGNRGQMKDDLLDASSSIAWSMIGDLIYKDPNPTVENMLSEHEPLEPVWKKLLKYTTTKNEVLHQSNALQFLAWGLAAVKILPSGPTLKMHRVDGKNLLFDKNFYENGGNPIYEAYYIIEIIEKRLSDLRRNRSYNKEIVEKLIEKIHTDRNEPEEIFKTKVYEIHARKRDGTWAVKTFHPDAEDFLQQGKEPIGTPPYAFLNQPGARGLNTGILSRTAHLDEAINMIMKRGVERSESRSDIVGIDATKIKVSNRAPGKGSGGGSKTERTFEAGQKGIATLMVNGDPTKALAHYKVGQISKEDMQEIDWLLFKMMWSLGSSPQTLSSKGAKKTATEVQFVEMMRRQRAGVIERLVDAYFDRIAQVVALTLKWMADRIERAGYRRVFEAALDDKEFSLFIATIPELSNDLSEFRFGIEPGSTRIMQNRFLMEAFGRLLEMFPALNQVAMQGGETLKLQPLLKPFMRALDLPIKIEDMLQPLPPQAMQPGGGKGGQGGTDQQPVRDTGGEIAEILAALQPAGAGGRGYV